MSPNETTPFVQEEAKATNRPRFYYLDNLKVLLTFLVVMHHVAQAYGPTGGEWPVSETQRSALLGPFITVNAMFFMGLFFFLSGYFTPGSLNRKGMRTFLIDRLLRLGIPSLVMAGILSMITKKFTFGHMWYAVDLLALSSLYVLSRRGIGAKTTVWDDTRSPVPSLNTVSRTNGFLFLFAAALGVVTALLRTEYPVDRWIMVAGLFPLEPAHAAQYLGLFVLGILAYRQKWLEALAPSVVRCWAFIAVLSVIAYSIRRLTPALLDYPLFELGGWNGRNLNYSLFEAVTCVSVCLSLLALFRHYGNFTHSTLSFLSTNAYGVYFIHVLVVVGIQMLLHPLPWDPLLKFAIASVLSLTVSYGLSGLILRRIPIF